MGGGEKRGATVGSDVGTRGPSWPPCFSSIDQRGGVRGRSGSGVLYLQGAGVCVCVCVCV